MLNRISTYLSNRKKYIFDQLARRKPYTSATGLCCISISPQELTFVYAREVAGKTTIELCESYPYKNKSGLLSTLTTIVKNNHLKNVPCCLMLQPEDYQLLVTDALPVTATEFQAAIRWKIKDLIRFPLDDVLIDSFSMPKMKANQDKIMVVAAQASKLKMLSTEIRGCGLNLKFIDIPELALRNITVLYEKAEQSTGLVYVQENNIQLLITFQQQIYVSRVLKFSLNNEDANAIAQSIERLASEIQRSFDYYQSLWDQPLPSQFIFASTKLIVPEASNLLSQKLKTPVQIINITDVLVCKPKINLEQQGKYLLMIGGVLREGTKNQQEINLYNYLPKKTGFELTPKTALLSYGAFLSLLLMFYFVSLWQKHKLVTQFDYLNHETSLALQQLTILVQQYPISDPDILKKTIGQLQEEYEKKAKLIDLLSPYANFSSYLVGLGNAIVSGVWLTQITFDRGENKIILKGYALQSAFLDQFYSQLAKQPIFSNLKFELNDIEQKKFPGSFYITAKKVNKA